ncbi:MAG TPA: GGDEF domain-containing protein [Thermoanaerobaculia bacterium]|nr:GGDEF domain-containing protein [Thermoanaerobaculia bacterium]
MAARTDCRPSKAVAEVFRSAELRAGELVARYGGEEFVALIHAEEAEAVRFGEKLRASCEARAIPHPASTVAPFITISLGVAARVPDESTSADALVLEADNALYCAKRAGRNRLCTPESVTQLAEA